MNATRKSRQSRWPLLAILVLGAWAAQSASAEPAAGEGAAKAAHGDGPKNAAQDGAAAGPQARGHHRGDPREAAKDAPANANELAIPPARRLGHKPYVFPPPHNAMNVRHWPTGVPRGPARNAIGIAIERGVSVKAPPALRPLPLAVAPGGPPKSATANVGAPAASNAPAYRGVTVPIANPPRPPGINGTGMIRVGAGPATIGGAPRPTTGINGTSFRPKHGG